MIYLVPLTIGVMTGVLVGFMTHPVVGCVFGGMAAYIACQDCEE